MQVTNSPSFQKLYAGYDGMKNKDIETHINRAGPNYRIYMIVSKSTPQITCVRKKKAYTWVHSITKIYK